MITHRPRHARLTVTRLDDRWVPSTLVVTSLADSGSGTLRGQIAAAANGDTIVFDPALAGGIVTLTSGQLFVDKSLTIDGLGSDQTTISRAAAAGSFRIFEIAAGRTVTISDLTITNGALIETATTVVVAGYGGGIYNHSGASLSLSNSIVSGNEIEGMSAPGHVGHAWGGGIYSEGSVTVTNSSIYGNEAWIRPTFDNTKTPVSAYGAGIYNSGTLSLANVAVTGNNIGPTQLRPITTWGNAYGGGVYSAGTLNMSGSLVYANTALALCDPPSVNSPHAYGGGLYLTGTSTITTSAIDGNVASAGGGTYADASDYGVQPTARGGGIYNTGNLTITRTTLGENDVSGRIAFGGGLYDAGTASLTNVTISGNEVGGWTVVPSNAGGGGIAVFGSPGVTTSFVTIANNSVTGMVSLPGGSYVGAAGGGVYVGSIQFTTDDTIIATNTATTYDNEWNTTTTGPDVRGTVNSLGRNLVGNTADSTGWVASDLVADPVLGPLQDNGGPIIGANIPLNPYADPPLRARTHELLATSPALQAGDPTRSPATDERGVARDTARPNIGAYEASLDGFRLTAPSVATANEPFDVTVTAIDPYGKTVYVYTGTVAFGSSDTAATLPGNYTFSRSENGVHTFAAGVTLRTLGIQTISVWDVTNPSLDGVAEVDVGEEGGGGGGGGGGPDGGEPGGG